MEIFDNENEKKISINQMRNVPEVWNKYMRDYHKNRMETDEEYARRRHEKVVESVKKYRNKLREEKIANGWIPKMGRKVGGKNKPRDSNIIV